MALADSVPGVSGGTIAFILGFYDEFIGSVNDLISGSKQQRITALKFLLKIGIGWVLGMILAMLILASAFESHIYTVSSMFMGFIVFAIPIICLEEKDTLKGKYGNLIFTLIGIALVSLITYFNPTSGGGMEVDISNLTPTLALYLFFTAMIAISAMVIPGISGSTLLLIFGLYTKIVSAIKDILHLNFECLPAIIIFGLGIIAGALSFIKILKICLSKYRPQVVYLVLGLMAGSLYAIVQGPKTLDVPQPAMTFSTFSIVAFIIGGAVIGGLQLLKTTLEKKSQK